MKLHNACRSTSDIIQLYIILQMILYIYTYQINLLFHPPYIILLNIYKIFIIILYLYRIMPYQKSARLQVTAQQVKNWASPKLSPFHLADDSGEFACWRKRHRSPICRKAFDFFSPNAAFLSIDPCFQGTVPVSIPNSIDLSIDFQVRYKPVGC